MRLWIRSGKKRKRPWFRPHLTIRNTGYARNHWQEQHFSPYCGSVGSETYPTKSLADAMNAYMAEIKRLGYETEWRP